MSTVCDPPRSVRRVRPTVLMLATVSRLLKTACGDLRLARHRGHPTDIAALTADRDRYTAIRDYLIARKARKP